MRLTGSAQEQRTKPLCIFLPPRATPLTRFLLFASLAFLVCLPFFFCLSAFRRSSSKAGCEVTFLKLAAAKRRRWLVLDEFAKYAFFGLKRKRRDFERSVLKYVSIKIPALTHSGRKSRVCVNAADRLCPGAKNKTSLYFSASPRHTTHTLPAFCFTRLSCLSAFLLLPFCLSPLVIKSGL